MIILLTGPTGVGKTDTSWEIIALSDQMVFLDCDWFASYVPFSWRRDSDVEKVYEALSLMIDFHMQRGARQFVLTLTIEMAFVFDRHRWRFERYGLPLFPFRLRCDGEVLLQRISERDRNDFQKQAELAGAIQAQHTFDRLSPEFSLLDTSAVASRTVAGMILAAATAPTQTT